MVSEVEVLLSWCLVIERSPRLEFSIRVEAVVLLSHPLFRIVKKQ